MNSPCAFSLEGRTAFVSGASRGIGYFVATALLEAGARVFINGRDATACRAAAAQLAQHGLCEALPGDLSIAAGRNAVLSELSRRSEVLDILINNAGTTWGAPIDEYPQEAWDKVLNLNLTSTFFLTQAALPLLRRAATPHSPARVINIGSVDGLRVPRYESYAYAASKAGLHHLTKTLAARLAPESVLVNAIAPGPFETRMTKFARERDLSAITDRVPLGRIGRPDEIGGAAVYLCAPVSSYITGVVLAVDGGSSGCRP